MAYTQNEKSTGLDILTTLASGDLHIVGDVSDFGRAKTITEDNLEDTIANSTNFVTELTANTAFQTAVNAFITSGGGGGTKISVNTTTVAFGSGTPVTAYTTPIPGGTLGTNDAIRFKVLLSNLVIGGGDSLGVIVKYGGTTLGQVILSGSIAGATGGIVFGEIIANAATNAQKFIGSTLTYTDGAAGSGVTSDTKYGTSAIDSTISQNLVIEMNPSGATAGNVQAIIVEGINRGTIRQATTSLTAADILDLNNTPVELVAAPGAGKVINILDINGQMTFVTGAYTTNTQLDVIYAGQVAGVLKNTTLLPAVATLIDTFIAGSQSKLLGNTALQLTTLSGNPAVGAGTLKVYVTYEIITL